MTQTAEIYFRAPLFKTPAIVARFRLDELAVILVLDFIAAMVGELAKPACRSFSWTDPTIGHPFESNETFPNWTLPLIVILPMFLYTACALRFTLWGKWEREAVNWFYFQLVAFTIQFFFVEFLKVYTGRLRPDFLARWVRAGYSPASTIDFCDKSLWSNELRDGHLSFPSGHSSTSFGAFVPVCLFLMIYLRPFASGGSFSRLAIALFPSCLPCIVAVSRTRDYRHNYDDVFAGAFIGIVASALSFALHFKSLPDGSYVMRHGGAFEDDARRRDVEMEGGTGTGAVLPPTAS